MFMASFIVPLLAQICLIASAAASDSNAGSQDVGIGYAGFARSRNFGGWTNKGGTWNGGWSNKNWGSVSQSTQNGGGSWGTGSLSLQSYRGDGGTTVKQGGTPWGTMNTTNSNPYTSSQSLSNTATTRTYTLHVAKCSIAPDGVTANNSICINGQFPGPVIEANYGDTLKVQVINDLTDQGTSMHWHGILQTNTSWNDGVPGTTQCPIPPGQQYTYVFQATLYGSTWYHTHYSAQYSDGAVGPLIIHGPNQTDYDLDVGPVMLTDWYHSSYPEILSKMMRPLAQGGPIRPLANSVLINGKGSYPCANTTLPCTANAGYSRFNFTVGAVHKLRLMNIGSAAIMKFSIDGHVMQVVSNDFVPVKPYNTSVVALSVGQRADVLVYGNGTVGSSFWMRSSIAGCSLNDGVATEGLAAIYYNGADTTVSPSTRNTNLAYLSASPQYCGNDPLAITEPMYPIPAALPSFVDTYNISAGSNGTHILYYFGGTSYRGNFNAPVLVQAHSKNLAFGRQQAVKNYGTNATIRAIIYNYDEAPHPIHLHGHNVQVLNLGFGKWDGSVVRASNPQRRDVQTMPPGSDVLPSFLVLQWAQDNPGTWGFHCHFAWHASLGLFTNILERPGDVAGTTFSSVPYINVTQCLYWLNFAQSMKSYVGQLDAGI